MFPILVGPAQSCSYNETLAVSGAGVFTFDYAFPYLYVVDEGTSGDGIMKIYDVRNAAGPILLSTTALPTDSGPRKPLIVGTKLYIPYRGDIRSLAIWDVTDRAAPSLLGSVDLTATITPSRPFGVAVIGDVACVVCSAGFVLSAVKVDVSNPASPTIVDTVSCVPPFTGPAADVLAVNGEFIISGLVTGGSSTPYISSVDPTTFDVVDSLSFGTASSQAGDIVSDGTYVYTCPTGTAELYTFNISDPANITQVDHLVLSSTGVGGFPNPMCIVESTNRVYMGRSNGAGLLIVIINISDRANPSEAGTISTSGDTVSDVELIDGCAGFAWGQGTGASIHLLGTAPLS